MAHRSTTRSTKLDATLAQVLAANNVVVAVDVDGTLMNGGSTYPWLAAVGGRWRTLKATVRLAPRIALAGVTGGTRADVTKQAVFAAVLRGKSSDLIRSKSLEFAGHHYRTRTRPEMKQLLAWHESLGHKVVLVSASVEDYISPIGDLIGARGALATKLQVSPSGLLTGTYDGKNCRGEEKLERLSAWMKEEFPDIAREELVIVAYGNSRGDLRMLKAAKLGINCGKLGPFSKLKSYPSLAELVVAKSLLA
jgi:phosphatidylglycerophosphatase C